MGVGWRQRATSPGEFGRSSAELEHGRLESPLLAHRTREKWGTRREKIGLLGLR